MGGKGPLGFQNQKRALGQPAGRCVRNERRHKVNRRGRACNWRDCVGVFCRGLLRHPTHSCRRRHRLGVARARRLAFPALHRHPDRFFPCRVDWQHGARMAGFWPLSARLASRSPIVQMGDHRRGGCRTGLVGPIENLCLTCKARSPVRNVAESRPRRCQPTPASSFMTAGIALPCCGHWPGIAASIVLTRIRPVRRFRRRGPPAPRQVAAKRPMVGRVGQRHCAFRNAMTYRRAMTPRMTSAVYYYPDEVGTG